MEQEDADSADPDSRRFPLDFWSLLATLRWRRCCPPSSTRSSSRPSKRTS